jgi:hypothetical protein
MHDITSVSANALPSSKRLLVSTLLAMLASAVLLITAVLPAEYGMDPTGIGQQLGLTALSKADNAEDSLQPLSPSLIVSDSQSPVWKSAIKYRSDSLSLTLQPKQGIEIKTKMKAGENFVFHWEAEGGAVTVDMHGEKINDGDNFTSYWEAQNQSSASGSFSAPFDGSHGWYWKNESSVSVTINLSVSGFYSPLYVP